MVGVLSKSANCDRRQTNYSRRRVKCRLPTSQMAL